MVGYVTGESVGLLIAFLLLAGVWLIITMLIPSLRRRPRLCYGVAIALVLLFALVMLAEVSLRIPAVAAAIISVALLSWQRRRAEAKQAAGVRAAGP
jgi:hypothetical protein